MVKNVVLQKTTYKRVSVILYIVHIVAAYAFGFLSANGFSTDELGLESAHPKP